MTFKFQSLIYTRMPSKQTHYVTTTLPTGCILVRSVLTLSAHEGHIQSYVISQRYDSMAIQRCNNVVKVM